MNQRRVARSSVRPIVILSVVVVVLAAAVYWFLIRDDDSNKTDTGSKTPTKVAAKTFTAPGKSFSFKYPGNFVETSGPQGYVWIAGVGKYDILSVKRIANVPTSTGRLKATIPDTLTLVPGTKIKSQGTDKIDGINFVNFGISTTVDGQAVSAKLYYFSANGVTWQLGCESQAQATTINAACAAALDSFRSH